MALTITLAGKRVRLLPEHALFRKGTLVVADVDGASAGDLARLGGLIKRTRAHRLVVLGDGRLPADWRARYPKLHVDELEEPFAFVPDGYTLAGHVRPGIAVRGRAGQSVLLPCFCFGPRAGILPAFSPAAETAEIHPAAEDRVFAIAGGEVLPCESLK